eukprot:scaffold316420_cov20-Tisochrysis_lutea.AAC.1
MANMQHMQGKVLELCAHKNVSRVQGKIKLPRQGAWSPIKLWQGCLCKENCLIQTSGCMLGKAKAMLYVRSRACSYGERGAQLRTQLCA